MHVELNVNGLSYIATFPDKDVRDLHLPLLRTLTRLQREKSVGWSYSWPHRSGGKSTLTAFWQMLSRQETDVQDLQGLPMDGFHHFNSYLDEQGLRGRKGAPDTFNLGLLQDHLAELKSSESRWPSYDRNLHDPQQNAIEVTSPIAVVEGNWLLLKEPGWQELIRRCDYSIFIGSYIDRLKERLIARKMKGGTSREDAERFFEQSDGPNVMRALTHSRKADLTLEMLKDGSYRLIDGLLDEKPVAVEL